MGREINFPMIGMLKDVDTFPEAIFENKVNEVQFRVKALSPIPKSVLENWKSDVENIYFNGFMTHVNEWAQQREIGLSLRTSQVDAAKKFLKDKLIFFKASIEPAGHLNIAKDSIKMIDKPKGINLKTRFTIVPIINMSDIAFQNRIISDGLVDIPYIDMAELEDINSVKYLYNNNHIYGRFGDNTVEKIQCITFKCKEGEVKRLLWDISDENDKIMGKFAFNWANKLIFLEESCEQIFDKDENFQLFTTIEEEIVSSLKTSNNKTTKKKKEGAVDEATVVNGVNVIRTATAIVDGTKEQKVNENSKEELKEAVHEAAASLKKRIVVDMEYSDEKEFFARLKRMAMDDLLCYDDKTLMNFHTAMKTGGLIVLNGISGTGKTKLARLYKEALGISDSQFKMVSVKPNWSDDSDVLGFMDVANNIYRPAESGIIDVLRDAELNPDKIYMVCFDEMNLARVEYYMSQFLSRLEMDGDDRKIVLYNKDREHSLYNSSRYPAEIKIGENIFFMGTINTDETTQAFSDKVLDRANLINTGVQSFQAWGSCCKAMMDNLRNMNAPEPVEEVTMEQFEKWTNRVPFIELYPEELGFFDTLNGLLAEYINKPIGYRVISYIDRYIKNIPKFAYDDFFDRGYALDLQIVQRILPKIRGTVGELQELIGVGSYSSKLIELFDNCNYISKFELSRKMIDTKRKELQSHGYTS